MRNLQVQQTQKVKQTEKYTKAKETSQDHFRMIEGCKTALDMRKVQLLKEIEPFRQMLQTKAEKCTR